MASIISSIGVYNCHYYILHYKSCGVCNRSTMLVFFCSTHVLTTTHCSFTACSCCSLMQAALHLGKHESCAPYLLGATHATEPPPLIVQGALLMLPLLTTRLPAGDSSTGLPSWCLPEVPLLQLGRRNNMYALRPVTSVPLSSPIRASSVYFANQVSQGIV